MPLKCLNVTLLNALKIYINNNNNLIYNSFCEISIIFKTKSLKIKNILNEINCLHYTILGFNWRVLRIEIKNTEKS